MSSDSTQTHAPEEDEIAGGLKRLQSPAVALTAYARIEDRLQALRSGYQMHVSKPVELAELCAVAASLASRGK